MLLGNRHYSVAVQGLSNIVRVCVEHSDYMGTHTILLLVFAVPYPTFECNLVYVFFLLFGAFESCEVKKNWNL